MSINVTNTLYKRALPCIYRSRCTIAPVVFSRTFHNHTALMAEPTFTQKVANTISGTAEVIKEGVHNLTDSFTGKTTTANTGSTWNSMDSVDTDKSVGASSVGGKSYTEVAKDRLAGTAETVKEAAADMANRAEKGWEDIKHSAFETKGRLKEEAHQANKDLNSSSTSSGSTFSSNSNSSLTNDAYELKGRAEQKASDLSSDIKSGLNDATNKGYELKGRAKEKAGI